ncbi:MaoC/PaaZ C-terminal domain-containing protein [Streptomyces sp. yr375]|uniref:MaoC/PaaZ C-terminal domain-containing protein n=1 Tax=Streptomyces sp. yr375 TaxID=1761906 RepID=UPI0015A6FDC7|nr:MaoC/PaaZ C-terminal domain-containing protein [Streptomyces sp. yr375]
MTRISPAPRAACPAYDFVIAPSEVARFRRLTGSATRPGPDRDEESRPVPAFFLCRALPRAVRAALREPDIRADPAAVRHAGQVLLLRRRPGAGERLTAHAVVEAVGDYGFQRALVLGVALRDAAGHDVAELVTTLTTGPAVGRGRLATPPARPPLGRPLLTWQVQVPDDLPGRYAQASGDHNPIHTDGSAARRAGLPGVVLHGMATLQLAAAGLADRLYGGDETRWSEVRTRFARPVRPGDHIEFAVHRDDDGPLALSASVGGRPVLKDTWFTGAVA